MAREPSPRPHLALVTGAGRGIGAAIARRIAREGVAVLVAGRSRAACRALAEEILAAGGRAWPLALDVASPASIASAVEDARGAAGQLGPIDWLVNNAGIAISAPLQEAEIPPGEPGGGGDLYERHLQVNFHGPRRLVAALLPGMRQIGGGSILNLASSAGLRGYPYVAAYCASKHALVGYTRAAAAELAKSGVCMNALCPHYVDSPMLAASVERLVAKTGRTPEAARDFFAAENPGGRLLGAEEVAEAAWGLLSGGRSGVLLELDGGPPRELC